MRKASTVFLWAGLAVAILGTGQFVLEVALSTDTNPNPAGSGILMVLSWYAGGTLAGIGLYLRGWRFPWV